MINPFDVVIQNQADDEKIIKVWRRHPVTLLGPALKVLAFAVIPFALVLITGPSMLGDPALAAPALPAAAGPALRAALGPSWIGRRVRVCGPSACTTVVLATSCQCYGTRLIDLSLGSFSALADPSRGLVLVEVTGG